MHCFSVQDRNIFVFKLKQNSMRTQFCIWLVNLLIERELTRQEINEAWRKSYYYDFKEISRNTFLEYKRKAEDLLDINIHYCPVKVDK